MMFSILDIHPRPSSSLYNPLLSFPLLLSFVPPSGLQSAPSARRRGRSQWLPPYDSPSLALPSSLVMSRTPLPQTPPLTLGSPMVHRKCAVSTSEAGSCSRYVIFSVIACSRDMGTGFDPCMWSLDVPLTRSLLHYSLGSRQVSSTTLAMQTSLTSGPSDNCKIAVKPLQFSRTIGTPGSRSLTLRPLLLLGT